MKKLCKESCEYEFHYSNCMYNFIVRIYCINSFVQNVCFLFQECCWIHHWVILQFVNTLFAVEPHTKFEDVIWDGKQRYVFKHKTWSRFIQVVDKTIVKQHCDIHNEDPRFGLVWL